MNAVKIMMKNMTVAVANTIMKMKNTTAGVIKGDLKWLYSD